MVLKHVSIESGILRICKSGSPRSMHVDSMLQANPGLNFSHISASEFSSASMVFWVIPRLPSAIRPLLVLPAISWTRRWGHLSVSFGSFIRSIRALCFFTITGSK